MSDDKVSGLFTWDRIGADELRTPAEAPEGAALSRDEVARLARGWSARRAKCSGADAVRTCDRVGLYRTDGVWSLCSYAGNEIARYPETLTLEEAIGLVNRELPPAPQAVEQQVRSMRRGAVANVMGALEELDGLRSAHPDRAGERARLNKALALIRGCTSYLGES